MNSNNQIHLSITTIRNYHAYPLCQRIDGQLHSISNTVHVLELVYNGTILSLFYGLVKVLPHDYSIPVFYSLSESRQASGVNGYI